MTTRDWALRYAEAGWRVYPVRYRQKKAMFEGWQRSATTDPELIARQWRHEPHPNIGLICGETFAVFDIEAPHLAAFHSYLDVAGHQLPEMPVAGTGRGGIHLYVQPIPSIATSRRLVLHGTHVGEFKTTGGVIAPPSVTVGEYRWWWLSDDLDVPQAPEWLTRLIREPSVPSSTSGHRTSPDDPAAALDALACAVRDEPAGNRNNILFWAARRAAEEGIRADVAQTVLRRVALEADLDRAEVEATIESGFSGKRAGA